MDKFFTIFVLFNLCNSAIAEDLGANGTLLIAVETKTEAPICPSYSFSQVPNSKNLFVGKFKQSNANGLCSGALTLATFSMDWARHVLTLLHPLMDIPATVGAETIQAAYDPYVVEFGKELWVAFECVGLHIPGTSACIAPLVDHGARLDLDRLSIPVVGLDSDANSPWIYSASTPKLLAFKGHLYLYWTAIQMGKEPPHPWMSIETRGAEMEIEAGGARSMWVAGREGRPLPSHAPGANVSVMRPVNDDPYSDTAVDTEGFLVTGDRFIILSSVGGGGPDESSACTKPLDKSPGCFRLAITESSHPLGDGAFREHVLLSPKLPANAVEYPRFVTDPEGALYILAQVHPVQVSAAPDSGKTLDTGLLLIPIDLGSLKFSH